MEECKLLSFILRVNIYVNKVIKTIGTAFIVGNNYAITAKHVIEKCGKNNFYLESYDTKHKIEKCCEYCSLKVKEQNIDIAIIKFEDECVFCTEFLPLSKLDVKLKSDYCTYGYPQINEYKKQYISGKVISPENKLSIDDSTGEYKDISLYSGVSGAPLVINDIIYGVISNEIYGTQVTLPELISSNFYHTIKYLDTLGELDDNKKILSCFLKEYCKIQNEKIENIDPYYNRYDIEYSKLKDKRNISEKILSVCKDFNPKKLRSWNRRAVFAREEMLELTTEQRKAIVMAVFFSCISYIDEEMENDLTSSEEISQCIDNLKKRAKQFVQDRKKDYDYGFNNTELIENIIFNIIDTCFLSFDSYLEE